MQPSPQTHPSPHFTNPQQSLHYVRPFGVNDPHDLSLLPYHSQQPSDNHSVNGFRSIQLNINGHTDFPNPIILKTQYKTVLCSRHTNMGYCNYGESCRFAHGEKELRKHPLYKTKPCLRETRTGECRHGSFCQFLHKSDIPGLRRPEEVTPIGLGIWSPHARNYSGTQCSFKGGIASIRARSPLGYYQQSIMEEINLPPLLGVNRNSGDVLHQSSGSLKSFAQDERDAPPGFGTQFPHAPHWNMFADSAGAFNMHDIAVQSYSDANDGNRMDWGMLTGDSFQMLSRGLHFNSSGNNIWRVKHSIPRAFESQEPSAVLSNLISFAGRRALEHGTPETRYSLFTDTKTRLKGLPTVEQQRPCWNATQFPVSASQTTFATAIGVFAKQDIPVVFHQRHMPAIPDPGAPFYCTQSSYVHGSSERAHSLVNYYVPKDVSQTGGKNGWCVDSALVAQMPTHGHLKTEHNYSDRGSPVFAAPIA